MLFILEAKSEATLAIENAVAQEHLTPEHPKKNLLPPQLMRQTA